MFTDSASLFQVITKATRTSERRLMIDVEACREAYEKREIADIALIRSEYNLADCMTKIMDPHQLLELLKTNTLHNSVQQCVIRCTQS